MIGRGRRPAEIRVGNAPCSWGTVEFEADVGGRIDYRQMLDELQATGYVGTELGDWGYLPTRPPALRRELAARELAMIGAFLPVALKDPAAHAEGEARAVRTARLLAAVGESRASGRRPYLVLADASGADPDRARHAGRIQPAQGLSDEQWRVFAAGAERIARAVRDATGLRTVFHHHCAGYVETPDEVARFLELTSPSLIGLLLDTGHYAYGAGGQGRPVLDALERFGERIEHVHFKDCDPRVVLRTRTEGLGYSEAIRAGVFCELGRGCVDFRAVVERLRATGYDGWVVVEQDVLPGMGAPRESARRNRDYLERLGL